MPKADTSWITEDLIDALAWTESKHKNTPETAYNKISGAAGKYQWTPLFYKEGADIGFGVDSGAFDPYDEKEARKRTRQYLEGMQKYYPDWEPEDVLMAYNWGHSNVRDLKSGKLNLEEYMNKSEWNRKKVSEAMNYPKLTIKNLMDRPWEETVSEEELNGTDPFPTTIDITY